MSPQSDQVNQNTKHKCKITDLPGENVAENVSSEACEKWAEITAAEWSSASKRLLS